MCGCGLDRFERNRFLLGVLQRGDANRIVMAAWMCTWCCKTHCNGCMNVAWDLCGEGSRSTKPYVFPCNRFLLSILQRVVGRVCVCVCVVLCTS